MIVNNLKKSRDAWKRLLKKLILEFIEKLKTKEISRRELQAYLFGFERMASNIAEIDKQIDVSEENFVYQEKARACRYVLKDGVESSNENNKAIGLLEDLVMSLNRTEGHPNKESFEQKESIQRTDLPSIKKELAGPKELIEEKEIDVIGNFQTEVKADPQIEVSKESNHRARKEKLINRHEPTEISKLIGCDEWFKYEEFTNREESIRISDAIIVELVGQEELISAQETATTQILKTETNGGNRIKMNEESDYRSQQETLFSKESVDSEEWSIIKNKSFESKSTIEEGSGHSVETSFTEIARDEVQIGEQTTIIKEAGLKTQNEESNSEAVLDLDQESIVNKETIDVGKLMECDELNGEESKSSGMVFKVDIDRAEDSTTCHVDY